MTWAPPQHPGDRNPAIVDAKKYLDRFSYGKSLGLTDEYTVEFGVALRQWAANIHYQVIFKGRPGPDVNMQGVFGWAEKMQMGLLDPPVPEQKPWIITVGGHMGLWDLGPAYWSALPLQDRGVATVQGVGYDAASLPFNNRSGIEELSRIVHHVKPHGVPWAIASHSQGAIITSDFIEHSVVGHESVPAMSNFRGGVQYGNPRRPRGVVAPWVYDAPDAGTQGLAHNVLATKLPGVEEVARRGDLYADQDPTAESTEWKTAIYRLVVHGSFLSGVDTLGEQLIELISDPTGEGWAIFQAITGGIQFLFNMDPHDNYDLSGATRHLENILK
jgi:hypothetical protein